jgi:anti-sigma factor RsiW
MSCANFETDVAMYAGGDLADGRMARVEAHLAECADCRALAGELRACQVLLGEMRDEPVEDAMLAQVHRRVMAEVKPTSWRPGLAPLLALAAALLLAVLPMGPRHPVKHSPVARLEPARAVPAPQVRIIPAKHRVMRRRRHAPAAQPGPPMLVQFVTDDPNIVVYWLIDPKPQGD